MRGRFIMVKVLLVTCAFVAGAVVNLQPGAHAQDATPAPGEAAGTPDAARIRTLAVGSIEILEPGMASLGLGRIAIAPAGSLPFDPNDASAILMYVTAGELTFRIEAPMTVTRGAQPGTPVPAPPEEVAANTEFTMRAGDSALFPPAVAGEVRNDADDEAAAWVVGIALLTEATATPTP